MVAYEGEHAHETGTSGDVPEALHVRVCRGCHGYCISLGVVEVNSNQGKENKWSR